MSGCLSVQGSVLADRYALEDVLGKGSMGAVYRAFDQKLRQPCAVKVLHRLVDEQDEHYGRFATEAAAITQLFHPNIVQVREFGQDKRGVPFLVMEFLRGRDLYSLLQERTRLSLLQTLDILRQVGSALHCAHSQGIVHRDIKPKNIFLSRQINAYGDEFEVVKVVDFGLSKFIGRSARNETGLGTILGTPQYLSPEATLGVSSAVDYRTDQWALGVMAYRMLSGRLPFDHDDMLSLLLAIRERPPAPLARLVPDLPAHVDAAIRRALSKKKEDRFATVQDFVRALDGLPSAHCAMQPAAPSAGAPTLMLPTVAMPGTVLSVPEPVIFEVSKRLRDAAASLPAMGMPMPHSRGDGVPKVEVAPDTTQPSRASTPRSRRPARRTQPWWAAALLTATAGLGVFGSLSAQHLLRSPQRVSAPVRALAQVQETQAAPVRARIADVAAQAADAQATGTATAQAAPPTPAARPPAPPVPAGSVRGDPASVTAPGHGPAPIKRGRPGPRGGRGDGSRGDSTRSDGTRSETRVAQASDLAAARRPAELPLPLTTAALDSPAVPSPPPSPSRISLVD